MFRDDNGDSSYPNFKKRSPGYDCQKKNTTTNQPAKIALEGKD